MEGYRFDPHVHTSLVSGCGKVHPDVLVPMYKEAGFSGIVITDHYYDGYFDRQGDISWEEKVERYCSGYRAAKEIGDKIGLVVLFGQEMRFIEHVNDYLAFGITPDDLLETPELYNLNLAGYSPYIHKKGGLLYQAHPYRGSCEPADPTLIDGVEVYNGHPGHDSHNDLGQAFCDKFRLREIAGSDFHQAHHLARGGVIFKACPTSMSEFIAMLRENAIHGLVRSD